MGLGQGFLGPTYALNQCLTYWCYFLVRIHGPRKQGVQMEVPSLIITPSDTLFKKIFAFVPIAFCQDDLEILVKEEGILHQG